MTSNKKFMSTIFDIFGYSLVGIMAYIYGLILQNYNEKNELINQLIEYRDGAPLLILSCCFQVFFICLFGFSYATVFFNKAERDSDGGSPGLHTDIFAIVGNWIEVILLCLFIAVFVFWIINPSIVNLRFWIVIFSSGFPFILSSMVYRIKSRGVDGPNAQWLRETKYVLICPAILMIGVNIYLGSSVLNLLRGERLYYIPLILFYLFFFSFYIVKNPKAVVFCIVFFLVAVVIAGALSYYPALSLPLKNTFLSIMTSIFLAIFECWYIAFRQLKDTQNKNFIKMTSYIVIVTPSIVFALFPIQDFKIIYAISFLGGMFATQLIWFLYIFPNAYTLPEDPEQVRKLRKNSGLLRAVFGMLVLVFLTLDKHIGAAVTPSQIRDNANITIDYSNLWAAATALAPIAGSGLAWWCRQKREKNTMTLSDGFKQADIFTLFCIRLVSYIVPAIMLWVESRFVPVLDMYKRDLACVGGIIFFLLDLIFTFYLLSKPDGVQAPETKQPVEVTDSPPTDEVK